MLRYKTETRPGLVALYNIWPGNGAGQFLQPQSPHGASISVDKGCKRPIQNTGGNLHGYLVFFVPSLAHHFVTSSWLRSTPPCFIGQPTVLPLGFGHAMKLGNAIC